MNIGPSVLYCQVVTSSQLSVEEEFGQGPWLTMKSALGLNESDPTCFLCTYSIVMVLRKVGHFPSLPPAPLGLSLWPKPHCHTQHQHGGRVLSQALPGLGFCISGSPSGLAMCGRVSTCTSTILPCCISREGKEVGRK